MRATWVGHLDLTSILAPRDARRYVRAELTGLLPDDRLDDVVLAVSEVVTNAVIHSRRPGTLRLLVSDGLVRVEVTDAAAAEPVQRAIDHRSLRGRGIALLGALSDRWGVRREPGGGKAVWFEVDRVHGWEAAAEAGR